MWVNSYCKIDLQLNLINCKCPVPYGRECKSRRMSTFTISVLNPAAYIYFNHEVATGRAHEFALWKINSTMDTASGMDKQL